MPMIEIDDKDYDLDTLSQEAKDQLAKLRRFLAMRTSR